MNSIPNGNSINFPNIPAIEPNVKSVNAASRFITCGKCAFGVVEIGVAVVVCIVICF
jgi:hypothetical protein